MFEQWVLDAPHIDQEDPRDRADAAAVLSGWLSDPYYDGHVTVTLTRGQVDAVQDACRKMVKAVGAESADMGQVFQRALQSVVVQGIHDLRVWADEGHSVEGLRVAANRK
jgi:hypothetical protein